MDKQSPWRRTLGLGVLEIGYRGLKSRMFSRPRDGYVSYESGATYFFILEFDKQRNGKE